MSQGKKIQESGAAGGGAVYGLAVIGALVYFLQQADSLWMGIVGIVKAVLWPAFLIYHALGALNL